MSVVGIFARADHPEGWGMARNTAHGFVVIGVRCADADELQAVWRKLADGWSGIEGATTYSAGALDPNGHRWFGGRFQLIATATDFEVISFSSASPRFNCLGDNRFVGVYEADEVLAAASHRTDRPEGEPPA